MSRQEILVNVFTKLKLAGVIGSKREFSQAMDYNYTCLSAAMNGDERYLTDRLFKRIQRAFPNVNPSYLKSGEGDVLLPGQSMQSNEIGNESPQRETFTTTVDLAKLTEELAQQREITRRAQDQTEKALSQIDQLIEIIRTVTVNQTK